MFVQLRIKTKTYKQRHSNPKKQFFNRLKKVPKTEYLDLSDEEMEKVREIAKREGITVDEAATRLVQKEIARRVKQKTGQTPAKVYSMRRK